AFFGITSFAVSLQYDEQARFGVAAELSVQIIRQILEAKCPDPELYNINIPTSATRAAAEVHIVPMGLERFGDQFLKRTDPKGRTYYWATGDPSPQGNVEESDLAAIKNGHITVTPLRYDLTRHEQLSELRTWRLRVRSQVPTG
ncbi:MAG TPA: 5'/3'-nucleotidase SurE, partial [Pirellulaceae bacterium]